MIIITIIIKKNDNNKKLIKLNLLEKYIPKLVTFYMTNNKIISRITNTSK